ncbi:hypothetical protein CYMTET_32565 [Cymbomonas tetramitiformis]|uniref:Uncharacterized protein n=1 Tax=Cymbomonas tetramitiformis TaxID=36881 RepID=A0AAE0FEL7_9CHLO|nr:hypothetical protein CYMTET_32565 [Cymbomonas tetramitiformis]
MDLRPPVLSFDVLNECVRPLGLLTNLAYVFQYYSSESACSTILLAYISVLIAVVNAEGLCNFILTYAKHATRSIVPVERWTLTIDLYAAVVSGIVASTFLWLFNPLTLSHLSIEPHSPVHNYYHLRLLCLPLSVVGKRGLGALSVAKRTGLVTALGSAASVFETAGTYFFVVVLNGGLRGSAIATLLSTVCISAATLWILLVDGSGTTSAKSREDKKRARSTDLLGGYMETPAAIDEKKVIFTAHWAAANGYTEVVAALLDAGEEIDATDKERRTMLHWAAFNGQHGILYFLISAGADKDARDENDNTAAHLAARNGHVEILNVLDEVAADLEASNIDGMTPLHLAAYNGHSAIVMALIAAGASIEVQSRNQNTPLHVAAYHGHPATVEALLSVGADLEARNSNEHTVLHGAASNGNSETVKALILAGAAVEARNATGFTAVHWAASNGHTDTLKVLIDEGADVNACDEDDETALHRAALKGHVTTVAALIQAGADATSRTASQNTPLHWAASNGHLPAVLELAHAGADIQAVNIAGSSALHWAAEEGHTSTARALLRMGAKKEAQDSDGYTPQQRAEMKGHTLVVNVLNGELDDICPRGGKRSTKKASTGRKTDLVGEWKMESVDNYDEFLKQQGVSWVIRSAASAMGYGVGSATLKVEIDGDAVSMAFSNPKCSGSNSGRLGEKRVPGSSPDGSKLLFDYLLEGEAVVMIGRDPDGKYPDVKETYEVIDGKLVKTLKSGSVVAKEIFACSGGGGSWSTGSTRRAAQGTSASQSGSTCQDLVGEWKMESVDNYDAFLKQQGLNWVIRNAASAMGYGVGSATLKVEIDGDDVSMAFSNPKCSGSNSGRLGEKRVPGLAPNGTKLLFDYLMEGEAVVMIGRDPTGNCPDVKETYELIDGKLVKTLKSGSVVAKEIFASSGSRSTGSTRRAAQGVSASQSSSTCQDLVGEWKMESVDNYDAFLKQQGVNWVIRNAASAMGYGVGSATLKVEIDGDDVSMAFSNPKCSGSNSGRLGEKRVPGSSPDGSKLLFDYLMEGEAVVMIGRDPDGKYPDVKETYEVIDGKLVKTLKSGSVVAKEIFACSGGGGDRRTSGVASKASKKSPLWRGAAKVVSASQSGSACQDLVGEWKMESVDNYDEFLKQQGVSWVIRSAASAMGYGVGSATLKVEIDGDDVSMAFSNPKCSGSNSGRLGEKRVPGSSPDGSKLLFDYLLEGEAVVMIGRDPDGKYPDVKETYEVIDGKLVKTLKSGSVVAKEIFACSGGGGSRSTGSTRRAAQGTSASQSGSTCQDLVGEWKMESVDNYDEFLKQQGVSWVIRSAASAMGYGVGSATLKVEIDGDAVSMAFSNPKCSGSNSGRLGEKRVPGSSPDGSKLLFDYLMEGEAVVMIGRDPDGKYPDVKETYEVIDGKLVKTLKSGSVVAKEIFACSGGGGSRSTGSTRRAAQGTSASQSGSTCQDLVGEWKMESVDNYDAFLKQQGLNWVIRNAASAMGYGVGSATLKVEIDGDDVSMAFSNPKCSGSNSGRLGEKRVPGLAPNGTKLLFDYLLEGEAVVMIGKDPTGNCPDVKETYELIDGKLVKTLKSGSVVANEVFIRI